MLLPEGAAESSFLRDVSASFYSDLYSDNRFRTGKKIKKAAEDLDMLTFVSEADLPNDAASVTAPFSSDMNPCPQNKAQIGYDNVS